MKVNFMNLVCCLCFAVACGTGSGQEQQPNSIEKENKVASNAVTQPGDESQLVEDKKDEEDLSCQKTSSRLPKKFTPKQNSLRMEARDWNVEKILGSLYLDDEVAMRKMTDEDYTFKNVANKIFEEELRNRQMDIVATLEVCISERQQDSLFTGAGGPLDTVGEMCRRVAMHIKCKNKKRQNVNVDK